MILPRYKNGEESKKTSVHDKIRAAVLLLSSNKCCGSRSTKKPQKMKTFHVLKILTSLWSVRVFSPEPRRNNLKFSLKKFSLKKFSLRNF
jgi:hypothetical protein